MLSDEGYITPRERSGYFVCDIDAFSTSRNEKKEAVIHLPCETVSSKSHDFEYSLWFKTVRKVISENGANLFVKSPNKGCSILRNAISDYLHRYRGMLAQPENIIIGSGSEQLYETVVKLLGRDKIYGIENPSYSQIEAVYRSEGVKIKKLKMGTDGIVLKELSESSIDILHVTPFRSYPSDVTTTLPRRYDYLHWAGNFRYIVEDDFNSEFFIPGQPIETLYSLDCNGRVIYINTFSKSLSPSMRMGYMILPDELLDIYNSLLSGFSCTVPVFEQYVLAEFISSGNFERHLNRMRRKMNK